LNSVLLFLVTK